MERLHEMIYICADLHLGHNNIHKLRPQFSTAEAHDSYVMNRWCEIIERSDTIYVLGDVAFNHKGLKKLINLPGRKQIILGNHDLPVATLIKHFNVMGMKEIAIGGKKIILTHIPISASELERYDMNVHGHVHGHRLPDSRYMDVSLESINYKPLLLKYC